MSPPVARRWLVEGRVQGVGYRMWLQREAEAAGVEGWVRNLSDGRVEALLRGAAESLDRLERLARRGPPHARVERVAAVSWPHPVPGGRFRQLGDAVSPDSGPNSGPEAEQAGDAVSRMDDT